VTGKGFIIIAATTAVVLLLCAAVPAETPLIRMSLGQIDSLLACHASNPYEVPAETARLSTLFLGMPYKTSPLGEGKGNGPDEDPMWSFEAVDCQTFIEEVIALAVSSSFQEFKEHLSEIRYVNEKRTFGFRNHLPEVQWLPNNMRKGYVRDITMDTSGERCRTYKRTLRPGKPKMLVEGRELPKEALPQGAVEFSYIPINDAPDILERIPSGAILNIIRVENPGKPYMITHQGLVVIKESKGKSLRYLRHASRHFGGVVSDMPLAAYLNTVKDYENWPALGISVFLPSKPRGISSVLPDKANYP
jgi:hypothetical protein